jgi:hypothetical protein
MAKSIEQRIYDSFHGDDSVARAKEYSGSVYAVWKDIASSLSRISLPIFLLMAVFELLIYQHGATSVSIGGLTLVNSPVVQAVLPAIIAFLIYESFRLSIRWLDLRQAYVALAKIWAPELDENGLDLLIRPDLPSFWSIFSGPNHI